MIPRSALFATRCGFTILELVTVVLVIGILATMLLPAMSQIQSRAQKTSCIGNLRSLHVAANLYVQEHHHWPQISGSTANPKKPAAAWISALTPYGLTQANWICPTVQRLLQSPDLTDPNNTRIDYIATPFDPMPQTPYKWAMQPWFVESADVHGNGNLILFPDGHIQELGDFKSTFKNSTKAPSGSH